VWVDPWQADGTSPAADNSITDNLVCMRDFEQPEYAPSLATIEKTEDRKIETSGHHE
jgi:hypothetical protein